MPFGFLLNYLAFQSFDLECTLYLMKVIPETCPAH